MSRRAGGACVRAACVSHLATLTDGGCACVYVLEEMAVCVGRLLGLSFVSIYVPFDGVFSP